MFQSRARLGMRVWLALPLAGVRCVAPPSAWTPGPRRRQGSCNRRRGASVPSARRRASWPLPVAPNGACDNSVDTHRLFRNIPLRRHVHAPAARPSRCGGGGRAAVFNINYSNRLTTTILGGRGSAVGGRKQRRRGQFESCPRGPSLDASPLHPGRRGRRRRATREAQAERARPAQRGAGRDGGPYFSPLIQPPKRTSPRRNQATTTLTQGGMESPRRARVAHAPGRGPRLGSWIS